MHYKSYLLVGLPFLFFLMTAIPVQAINIDPDPGTEIVNLETKADFEHAYDVLKDQVQELKSEKNEAVTKADKKLVNEKIKETKKEIQALKAKALNGGIYIGSGALVVILLLIILL